jgi:hypothetical protein
MATLATAPFVRYELAIVKRLGVRAHDIANNS